MILEAIISTLISSLSYLGVFVASALISLSIIFPLPWYPIVLASVFFNLNPILTSIMFSAGSMLGEVLCYKIGSGGSKLISQKFKNWKKSKKMIKLVKYVKYHFKRHGFLTIFITSLIIFPFDIVSLVAGAYRYDIKKYMIAGILGKFFKILIVIVLTTQGIHYLGYLM